MSLWDPTQYQSLSESELVQKENLDEDLITKIGSNEEYIKSQLDLVFNAWNLGDDVYSHFAVQVVDNGSEQLGTKLVKKAAGGFTHDAANHLYTLASGADAIWTPQTRRSDTVPSIVEARVKVSDHTNPEPFIGFTIDATVDHTSAIPADVCVFEKGTNSNTWKARTRSGGFDRTTTDNLSGAGAWPVWDTLRVEFRLDEVKYFINDTLAATHTTNTPNTAAMQAFVQLTSPGGATLKVDFLSYRAISNSLSP